MVALSDEDIVISQDRTNIEELIGSGSLPVDEYEIVGDDEIEISIGISLRDVRKNILRDENLITWAGFNGSIFTVNILGRVMGYKIYFPDSSKPYLRIRFGKRRIKEFQKLKRAKLLGAI